MARTLGRGLAHSIVLGAGMLVVLDASALERRLGAPVIDSEAETTHRRITWDDFKSLAKGDKIQGRGKWAFARTEIRLGGYEVETRRDADGEWVAESVGLRPYAVFDKFRSGVSPGARAPQALRYQQLQFDLAEVNARRLAVELHDLVGRGEIPYDAEEDLRYQLRRQFERRRGELEEIHLVFEDETHSGSDRRKLEEWAAKIETMFEEGTAELVALLEEGDR